jgi:hypothetical protein
MLSLDHAPLGFSEAESATSWWRAIIFGPLIKKRCSCFDPRNPIAVEAVFRHRIQKGGTCLFWGVLPGIPVFLKIHETDVAGEDAVGDVIVTFRNLLP